MFLDVTIDHSDVPTQMDRSFLFDFLELPPSHSSNEDPNTYSDSWLTESSKQCGLLNENTGFSWCQ